MSWPRRFTIGALGIVGGVFGNLIAASIEGSLGRFTILQIAAMIAGIIIVVTLSAYMEHRPSQDISHLKREILNHRRELHKLYELHVSGIAWTPQDVRSWVSYKSIIAEGKEKLREKNVDVPYDPIDDALPPRLGCLARMTELLRHVTALLVILLLFAIAVPLSAFTQVGFLRYVATPTPTATSVPTPAVTPRSPSLTPSNTLTPTNTPRPTLASEEPTSTPEAGVTSVIPKDLPDSGGGGLSTTPLPPTQTPSPIVTNPPTFSFSWGTQITCSYIENRVNNFNSEEVQVTGFIAAKPDNGDEKTISEVPPPYQNCPSGGWCGPIEDIHNHYLNFQGVVWGTTWVQHQGVEVASKSFGPTSLSCNP